jgi:N-acetylmuramoyl-L-alanine amidase
LAGRANHFVLLICALVCAAASLCSQLAAGRAAEDQPSKAVAVTGIPVVSDLRLAGDTKQTRFIIDLDKTISYRAFLLADPYRVVLDIPQVSFQLPVGVGTSGRGLIKTFRYGLVVPGGSRIVFDLNGPARIANSYVLEPANGQPPRLVLELEEVDRTTFVRSLSADNPPELRPVVATAKDTLVTDTVATTEAKADVAPKPAAALDKPAAVMEKPAPVPDKSDAASDLRPVIVIDPGHGGIDNGTQSGNEYEKTLVLGFGLALRDRIEKSGKYRVVMTRTDDTFIPLNDRVKIAHNQSAALFVSIHADALPRREGDAQGATIYTLSDRASDAEAERLAESENKADAIGGVNLTEEPTDVADILIDLAQRETRTFSNRFARLLMGEMKTTTRMHKHPLKSAGFRVLKAPDVPSVLIELGYVSNKDDLEHLVSENWRSRTVGSVAQAIDAFFAERLVTAGTAN